MSLRYGIEPTAKRCAACGEVKPLDQFHRQPAGPQGRHSYCKPCANERQRASRVRHYSPERKRRCKGNCGRLAPADEARRAWLDARAYDRPSYTGNGRALSDNEVRTVRRLVAEGVPQSEVARMTGLCRSTVSKIVLGKRYREVE